MFKGKINYTGIVKNDKFTARWGYVETDGQVVRFVVCCDGSIVYYHIGENLDCQWWNLYTFRTKKLRESIHAHLNSYFNP